MDLTLDNLHVSDGGVPTVFDFDSAGRCWRAVEPWGVLRFSRDYFRSWLTGYRRIRPFAAADEQAVSVFGVLVISGSRPGSWVRPTRPAASRC